MMQQQELGEPGILMGWWGLYDNDGMGHRLVACLQHYLPDLQPDDVLRLDHGDIGDELPLPLALLTAIKLSHIWKTRD